ncbi:MAG: hypothetical protein M3M89_06055, partial [Thermoproteota archaeon]|nr:hypothetical protein [Thermoproteota archaeon]
MKRSKLIVIIPKGFFITAVAAILIFSMTGISHQQVQPPFDDEEAIEEEDEEAIEEEDEEAIEEDEDEEDEACIDYEEAENTIAINCDASFLDVVEAINDPEILDELEEEEGHYLLNANLEVADDVTFAMNSNEDGGLQYLK